MITRTINNPFHTVVLNYDKEKTETAFEKELLNRYLAFLNKMHEMRKRIKPLKNRYYKEQLLIEDNVAVIAEHHQHYKDIEKTMNRFKKTRTIVDSEFHAMKNKFYARNKKYLDYYAGKVDPWREVINGNEKEFRELHEWFDKDGDIKAYNHFSDYAEELYNNYDNYAMDICQYDVNVNDMKGEWGKANKEWRTLFKLREETVALSLPACDRLRDVNTLCESMQKDTDEMYDSWLTSNN